MAGITCVQKKMSTTIFGREVKMKTKNSTVWEKFDSWRYVHHKHDEILGGKNKKYRKPNVWEKHQHNTQMSS